jgi:hypothetical protein
LGEIVDGQRRVPRAIAEKRGIHINQTIAVEMVLMIYHVELSRFVAFHAKPTVKKVLVDFQSWA